jgi:hypothetical protein
MTKISALSDIGTSVASNDTFVLVDVSDPTTPNKKIQQQNLFLIPDGSAGTPGLRFLSDTNVGVFRPTTDTLAIATGGSERLRIDSSGRLGLGTSSPSELLTVGGATVNIGLFNSTPGTTVSPSFSTINFYGFSQDANGNIASISAGNSQTNEYGGVLRFSTNTTGATHTERMRIDSSGRVGIGTTSPNGTLDINNGAAVFSNSGSYIGGIGRANGLIGGTTSELAITTSAAQGLLFGINNTERMRLDSSGRLGLGTSSPSVPLDLNYSNSSTYSATTDVASSAILFNINATANTYAALKLSTYGSGGGSAVGSVNLCALASSTTYGAEFVVQQRTTSGTFRENLRITHDGKVGIGTTSPGSALDIRGDFTFAISESAYSTNYYGVLHSENAGDTGYLQFRGASGLGKAIGVAGFGTETVLFAGSTERARIDSSGRLGLGTSSPAAALDVVGQINSTTGYASNKFGVNTSAIPVTTSTAESFARFKTTGSDFYIGTESSTGGAFFPGSTAYSAVLYNASSTPLHFYTAAVVRATIDSSGNVGIGTTTPSSLLEVFSGTDAILTLTGNVAGANVAAVDFKRNGGTVNASVRSVSVGSNDAGELYFSTRPFAGSLNERARIDSSGRLLVGTSSQSGGSLLQVNDDRIRIASSKTPASASDTGTAGEICWDADYIYVCTATDTWKRTAISTW